MSKILTIENTKMSSNNDFIVNKNKKLPKQEKVQAAIKAGEQTK